VWCADSSGEGGGGGGGGATMIGGIAAGVTVLLAVVVYFYCYRNKSRKSERTKSLSEPLLHTSQHIVEMQPTEPLLHTSQHIVEMQPMPASSGATTANTVGWASPQAKPQVKQVWYYRLKGYSIKPRAEPDVSSAAVREPVPPGVFKVVERIHEPAGIMNLGYEQTYLQCAEGGWLFANHPQKGDIICTEVHSVTCKHCDHIFKTLDDKFCAQVCPRHPFCLSLFSC
jgi:hypothetical protein